MKNKYKAGDVVYAKENSSFELVVRRYADTIYYCRAKETAGSQELVYLKGN